MYDVCLDALPFLIASLALAIVLVRGWELFRELVTGGE
jgi:hypothetical protein